MIHSLVLLSSCCIVFAQEAQSLSGPDASDLPYGLQERHLVDYEPRRTDLWLISPGDPIPVSLNRQIVAGAGSGAPGSYGARFTGAEASRTVENSQQPPMPVYYQPGQAAEIDRQERDVNLNAPEPVLVELPVEVTEGLWVRPRAQTRDRLHNAARYTEGDTANARVMHGPLQNGRELPLVFGSETDFVPQLPRAEFSQNDQSLQTNSLGQASQFAPTGQDPRILYQPHEVQDQSIWVLREDNGNFPPVDNLTTFGYHSSPNTPVSIYPETANEHGYGVLTSEDIELLERLGILSAVVIEPMHPGNESSNFTLNDKSQRETEGSEQVLIDQGGQSYSQSPITDGVEDLRDVVFIDIPHFTTPEYTANLPENIGLGEHTSNSTLEPLMNTPLKELDPEVKNESAQVGNATHLTDRQILEILQLLSLNFVDMTNSSSFSQANAKSQGSVVTNTVVPTTLGLDESGSPKNITGKPSAATIAIPPTASTAASAESRSADHYKPNPSVVVERLQPGLLQKLSKADSEIFDRLLRVDPATAAKAAETNSIDLKPKPYLFGFKQTDANGTLQHRDEKSDALGVVKGNYGYKDAFGVFRNVSYIADGNGFHAVVRTNEPGTVSHNTADAVFMSETPPLGALVKMMAYRRIKDLINSTRAP